MEQLYFTPVQIAYFTFLISFIKLELCSALSGWKMVEPVGKDERQAPSFYGTDIDKLYDFNQTRSLSDHVCAQRERASIGE